MPPSTLLLALWAALSPAEALDVCRGFDVTEGDPRRGPSLVVSDGVSSLSQVDGRPELRVPFYEGGAITEVVPAGTEVDWHLADESLVTMVSLEDAAPAAVTYGGGDAPVGVNTRWRLAFVLSDAIVHALARSPLERLRYTLVSTPVDVEVTRRRAVGWQRLAACYAMRTRGPDTP